MNKKVTRPTSQSIRRNFLLLCMGILVILMGVTTTGMTGNHPVLVLAADEPTLTPVFTATPLPSSWLGRFLQPNGDPASLTLGIIIMGGVIVLIIIGGTFAVTRRKY
jgi:hypothetical protein